MTRKESADIPSSQAVKSILDILKTEGYIDTYKSIEDKRQGILRVYLKYTLGKSAIRNLKRISKPGLRIYVKQRKIPRVLRGKGLAILSTPKGILTDTKAREENVGGEVICYVW